MAALDSRTDCGTRFSAAEKISSPPGPRPGFLQIALSSVDCRNNEVLTVSVNRISDPVLRDDTAYRCAIALAKAGRGMEAATIANAIVGSDLRARAVLAINRTTPEQKGPSPGPGNN